MGKNKTGRFAPTPKNPITVEGIRKRLRTFDPQKAVNDYLAQDPRHLKNEAPKHIYEINEHTETQATRIVKKFGGVAPFLHAMKAVGYPLSRQAVYQWSWTPQKGGTGGLIPTRAWPFVHAAARLNGIFISPGDADARSQHIKNFKVIATVINHQVVPTTNVYERRKLKAHNAHLASRKKTSKAKTQKIRALRDQVQKLQKTIFHLEKQKALCKCNK